MRPATLSLRWRNPYSGVLYQRVWQAVDAGWTLAAVTDGDPVDTRDVDEVDVEYEGELPTPDCVTVTWREGDDRYRRGVERVGASRWSLAYEQSAGTGFWPAIGTEVVDLGVRVVDGMGETIRGP